MHIEIFNSLRESTTPTTLDLTGATETERVPFFNVKDLTIASTPYLSIEGFKTLLAHAFPGLERLHLAGMLCDYRREAIYTGTAPPTQVPFWYDTDIDQVPTEAVKD